MTREVLLVDWVTNDLVRMKSNIWEVLMFWNCWYYERLQSVDVHCIYAGPVILIKDYVVKRLFIEIGERIQRLAYIEI
jgi:hypothetical protein